MVCYMIVDQNKENYDMAKRIAQFEKVSFGQFKKGYSKIHSEMFRMKKSGKFMKK